MWFRRKPTHPAQPAPEATVERRTPVRWCTTCRSGIGPLVYLENGKHYCKDCAVEAGALMRLRPDGKRADDVKSA